MQFQRSKFGLTTLRILKTVFDHLNQIEKTGLTGNVLYSFRKIDNRNPLLKLKAVQVFSSLQFCCFILKFAFLKTKEKN